MSKKHGHGSRECPNIGQHESEDRRPPAGGGGLCLLNTMLLLAAPTALVALIVKGVRR